MNIRIKPVASWLIFFSRAGAGAFQLQFLFGELELQLLGSIFSAQSWSWSLKALGVKLEPAPNWSRLSISGYTQFIEHYSYKTHILTKSTIFCKKKNQKIREKKALHKINKKKTFSVFGGSHVRPLNTLKLFLTTCFINIF